MEKFAKKYEEVKYYNTRKRPLSVSWDITNKCNMRCMHCFNNSGDELHYDFNSEFTESDAVEIAKQIVEIRPDQCCLCGGETLLFPYLISVIKILSKGNILTNIVTNGYIMTEQIANDIKKAGISHVQISLDGLGEVHDVFRNTKSAFENAVRAIKILKNKKLNVLVSFCPNAMNYLQFEDYVAYVNWLKVKTIRMMPLLPLGRGNVNFQKLMMNSDQTFDFIQRVSQMREHYPHMSIEWGDPLEHLHLVLTTKRKYPVVMSIQSNGDLNITPYVPIVVGNIKQKSLLEYWENGYNKIWSDPRVLSVIREITSIYSLEKVNRNTYHFNIDGD